ncbi:hypothetical protein GCM10010532_082590 [Dactylosporangium siamense]|uniref:Uncharacterized protein n=1 Tax=Dactylosporangium siamense TaxID=685454 RepID=A0A919PP04_9ACTN|nr:hypothetical protein Dsi01nite_061320 [Dactylosporangium siamense]
MWAISRGLAIGVSSATITAAVVVAIAKFTPVDDSPCDSDLACLPDVRPVIYALTCMPLVIAIVGPLIARLVGASRPLWFAVPAAWVVVLACIGLGPADGQDQWPFNDPFSSIAILLAPYIAIALRTSRPAHADEVIRSGS